MAVILALPPVARADEQTVVLKVDNMSCATCPYIVREALSAVPGVSSVAVSFEDKHATVVYDNSRTTIEALAAASANAGYPAAPLP